MHALGPSGFRAAFRHLPINTPVTAIILFREIVRRGAPAFHVHRMLVEALVAVGQQARTLTTATPAFEDLGLHGLGINVAAYEPDFVRVRMPTVVAVRQLKGANQAFVAVASLEAPPWLSGAQPMQGVFLLFQKHLEVMPGPVGERESHHDGL